MKVIALMGKAGSGKDTLLHFLVGKYPSLFNEIISCTTRAPREGETEGVNYYFLSIDEFMKKVQNGDMLEYTQFNGWYYGTTVSSLSTEKINLGVFNPAGVRSLLKANLDTDVYYVRASDKERLLRQLNREQNPDVEEIIRRFAADKADFDTLDDIPYISLDNNTYNDLLNAADSIVKGKID